MDKILHLAAQYYPPEINIYEKFTDAFIYPGLWDILIDSNVEATARLSKDLNARKGLIPADYLSLFYYGILPLDPNKCDVAAELKRCKNIEEVYSLPEFKGVFDDLCSREVFIYTDGACSGNGKSSASAAFACVFDDEHFSEKVEDCAYISEEDTIRPDPKRESIKPSNNRGELLGFIFGLMSAKYLFPLSKKINLFSDSKYSIDTITKFYPARLKKGTESELLNPDLLTIAFNLYSELDLTIHHVRSHQKSAPCKFCNRCQACVIRKGNESADKHATSPNLLEGKNWFLSRRFIKMYNPVSSLHPHL